MFGSQFYGTEDGRRVPLTSEEVAEEDALLARAANLDWEYGIKRRALEDESHALKLRVLARGEKERETA